MTCSRMPILSSSQFFKSGFIFPEAIPSNLAISFLISSFPLKDHFEMYLIAFSEHVEALLSMLHLTWWGWEERD